MKTKTTFGQKFKYFFDNTLSRGTGAIIMWLAIVSLISVIIFGALYSLSHVNIGEEEGVGFFEAMWQSLMRSFDAGNMADDSGLAFRTISLLVTIFGILILSALIGVISSGLDDKLQELRKGRSLVIEDGHTLILGWSPKIIHIIEQLIVANENQKKSRIVILADKDKIEMEDTINDNIANKKTTKIICRSGNPLSLIDLEIVNPHAAKSIIVLSPEIDNPDTHVIKSVLAITHHPKRKAEKYHIVAEITEKVNLEAAYLVGKDEAIFVLTPDLTARIAAQTSRQAGLSIIYMELLCYEGDEIYIQNEPKLAGKSFKDAIFAYNTSSIIGFMNKDGQVKLNPPMNTLLSKEDKIVAISEDDDTITLSGLNDYKIVKEYISENGRIHQISKEKNLVLGWNHKGHTIIKELDNYVGPGSTVHIITEVDIEESIVSELKSIIANQSISIEHGNISDRTTLSKVDVTSFDNIIILSYTHIDQQEADAKTLIALLHIRNFAEKTEKKLNIVSEMFDQNNRELAAVTKADDFIISDNLISRMLTQLSENRDLKKVFDDLFSAEGSEIYLKDALDYVIAEYPVNFYTVLEAAANKGQTAIGYRKMDFAHDVDKNYGIKINPVKTDNIYFTEGDKIIVLAED
jgi:voltage-gated potassium channel Kch